MLNEILIMPSTIKPGNVPSLSLKDPRERLFQLLCSLISWVKFTKVRTIVLGENSSPDCDFRVVIDYAKDYGKTLEVIFCPATGLEEQMGKGAGEGLMMKHILESSKWIDQETKFYKITGKLFISNFDEISERYRDAKLVFKQPRGISKGKKYFHRYKIWFQRAVKHFDKFGFQGFLVEPKFLSTKFYKCQRSIYDSFLKDCYKKIDDRQRCYLEHVFYYALKGRVCWDVFSITPNIIGMSGTRGKFHHGDYPEETKRLAKIFLSRMN